MKKLITLLLFVVVSISAQPTIPTGFSHSVALDGSSIVLSWDDNTDEDGYILRHQWIVNDPEGPWPQPGMFFLDSNTTEFRYELAREGEKYSFQLSAYNEDGESDYTFLIVISSPHVGATQISVDSIIVKWDSIVNAEAYEVSVGVVSKYATVSPRTFQTDETHLIIPVECGYSYRIFVSASGEDVYGLLEEEPTIFYVDCNFGDNLPASPSGIKVVYTRQGALLTWDDNSDNEEGFWISKIVDRGEEPSARGWINIPTTSVEKYIDTDVEHEKKYSYRIFSYNEYGWSDPSSRYLYQHLPRITGIGVELYDSNNLRVVWSDTNNIDVEYYLLYWSPEDEDEFFNVDSIDVDAEAINFPSGFCGKNSFYMTSVFSSNGREYESLPSDTVWITITDPGICGISDVDNEKELSFSLSQNYPNPFNPSTKIQYTLSSYQQVHLTVYDVLGSEVTVLVNETQGAGEYSVVFNASLLPSGIYFYHLEAGQFQEIKKMMLVK